MPGAGLPSGVSAMSAVSAVRVAPAGPPRGGRCDGPRARARPRGRDLAPTFIPGAVPSSGEIAEIARIAVPSGPPRGGCCDGPRARAPSGRDIAPRSPLARSYRAVPPRWAERVTWCASLRPGRSSHIPRGRAQPNHAVRHVATPQTWASPLRVLRVTACSRCQVSLENSHKCPY